MEIYSEFISFEFKRRVQAPPGGDNGECITESGDARDLRLAKFAPAGIFVIVVVLLLWHGSGKIVDAINISSTARSTMGCHVRYHTSKRVGLMLMRVELHCISCKRSLLLRPSLEMHHFSK